MRHHHSHLPRIRFALAVCLGIVCLSPSVQKLASFPNHLQIHQGEQIFLPSVSSKTTTVSSDSHVVEVLASPTSVDGIMNKDVQLVSEHVGDATISERLFGFFPWKAVHVKVVPQENVYVGGQSVGIRLDTHGAMVIGYQRQPDGQSPATDAHLKIGDVIEKVGTHLVDGSSDLRHWVNATTDQGIGLQVRRGSEELKLNIKPSNDSAGVRHLGLYVRDKTAGVGTLTFYDATYHCFGALGHIITDVDTGQPVTGSGHLYPADITGVVKGAVGQPGEKKGHFSALDETLGNIQDNSSYGVFGVMNQNPLHSYLNHPVPLALPSQVHTGPAQILTVLKNQQVERFNVEIENLVHQDEPSTKSMIVHVVDPRLLEKTGGIVQGMSGSPILQDGKLIGAVTHVFVSDPTRGYGVYAEWMLHEAIQSQQANQHPTGLED